MQSKTYYKKQKQLGMNPGTASYRLVKDILFKLICDCNKNKCYQCDKKMTRKNFSIEHKIHWLDSNKPFELFFDLDNISFSHRKCNIQNARRKTKAFIKSHAESRNKLRIKSKSGFSWCCACKKHLKINKFTKNLSRRNYLQSECKNCRSEKRSNKLHSPLP